MKVFDMLSVAFQAKASDVYLLTGQKAMFRMGGALREYTEGRIETEDFKEELFGLCSKEQLERLEHEGELRMAAAASDAFRVRFSVCRQQEAYAVSARILPAKVPKLDELSAPPLAYSFLEERKGLVLVTGEAGSGKTTTACAIVSQIAESRAAHIVALGGCTEYLLPQGKSIVFQREFGRDFPEYGSAVRAAASQGADVLLIDGMDQSLGVWEACSAALSGSLVILTAPACGAQEALRRIVAAFPEELRQEARNCLADTLKGVLTQQLLPVSGVEAQTAAFEGLCPDSEMRALVREGRMGQIASLMEMREDSMAHTMDGAILSCYMKSQISSKTALLYAADRERMQQRMRIY